MLAGIAHDVRHRSFLPTFVDFRVAFLAGCGTDIVRRGHSRILFRGFLRSFSGDRANKKNQLPRAGVVLPAVRISERGHSRQPHAVLDDVMNFAVAEVLRLRELQIGRLGIQILPDARSAVAILAVAAGAVAGEILSSFREQCGSRRERSFFIARRSGDAQVAHGACDDCLGDGGLIDAAESLMNNGCSVQDRQDGDREQDQKKCLPAI